MSASRPASVMLRAAIATSGGTEAPDVTYCSIWPWTEAISASTPRVLECASSITSTRASSSLTGSGATSLWLSDSIWLYVPSVEVAHRIRFVAIDVALDISFIEQVEDADLAERLELEDDLDARQVDPLASGEEADDTHPPDVRLRVEAEVVPTLRTEESLLLVDAQRPWMHARQLGGDADEIARSLEIAADAHAVTGSLKGRIG